MTAMMLAILAEAFGQKMVDLLTRRICLGIFMLGVEGQCRAIVEQHIHRSPKQGFGRLTGDLAHLVDHRAIKAIHALIDPVEIERDASLMGQRVNRCPLAVATDGPEPVLG